MSFTDTVIFLSSKESVWQRHEYTTSEHLFQQSLATGWNHSKEGREGNDDIQKAEEG